jgi:hypothetical protein
VAWRELTQASIAQAMNRPAATLRRLLGRGGLRRLALYQYLSVLGPGLVAANAGNDAGG